MCPPPRRWFSNDFIVIFSKTPLPEELLRRRQFQEEGGDVFVVLRGNKISFLFLSLPTPVEDILNKGPWPYMGGGGGGGGGGEMRGCERGRR